MDDYEKKKLKEEQLKAWRERMAANGAEFQKGFNSKSEEEKKKSQWGRLASLFGK